MTYDDPVTAELDGDRIYLSASWRRNEAIKTIPGSKWDKNRGVSGSWWLPKTWSACKQLRAVFGDSLVVGPELATWSVEELTQRIQPTAVLRLATSLPDDDRSTEAEVIRSWRTK